MGIREHFMEVASRLGGEPASPVADLDSQAYRNFLMRALSGEDNVPAAVKTRVQVSRSEDADEPEDRDRRWFRDFLLRRMIEQHNEEIDRLIARYNEMADWHHEQAEAARARMTEAADRLAEIDEFLTGADEVFREKERTGKLDRERALELLRSRGVEVDPQEGDESLLAKLRKEEQRAQQEGARWSKRYEDADGARSYHEDLERENRRKAQELVNLRDAIRGGGYDPEEEERRLRQVADEYKRDIQTRAFEIEQQQRRGEETARDLLEDAQESIDSSQSQSEEADFLASMDNLTATFNLAAADAPPADPSPDAPTPKWSKPGGPGSAV